MYRANRSILHDPTLYPLPKEFKPERFLKDGRLDPKIQDPSVAAFGFGRRQVSFLFRTYDTVSDMPYRICPGTHFSDTSLYGMISHVLADYNITPPVDDLESPINIGPEVTSGLLS
jgi:cytochrome P450